MIDYEDESEKLPSCAACDAPEAECRLPLDDGPMPLCWRCTHNVIEHSKSIDEAPHHDCDCPAERKTLPPEGN